MHQPAESATMSFRVMVIEGQSGSDPAMSRALISSGFSVTAMEDRATAYKSLLGVRPDVIVVNTDTWGRAVEEFLFDLSNLRITRFSRKIVLAMNAGPQDSALALEAGADDFLRLPLTPREFAARIKATVRSYSPAQLLPNELVLGSLRLRRAEREVFVGEERKILTPTEFNLLAFLMDNPREVLTRDVLLENVWPQLDEDEASRIVDVYVNRVREKIELAPAAPQRLVTKRGFGYCLIDPEIDDPAEE